MHMNQQDDQKDHKIETSLTDLSGKTLDEVERYYRLHYKWTDEYLQGMQTKGLDLSMSFFKTFYSCNTDTEH